MIKTLRRLVLEGNFLNLIKSICEKPTEPTAYIILNGEKLSYFLFKIENKVRMSTLTASMQHFTGGPRLCNAIIKGIQIGKEDVLYFPMTSFLPSSH